MEESKDKYIETISKIGEEYDQRFTELVEWFWTNIGDDMSLEEKCVLYEQLKESTDIINKRMSAKYVLGII